MAPYENTRLRARMAELAAKNKNQSGAVPDSPSPFFRLPGEIRNKIYSYALHCPTNLFYYPVLAREVTKLHPSICAMILRSKNRRSKGFPWFNQLQFVNRQLRSETRWRELKYSVLDITNTWDRGCETLPWIFGHAAEKSMNALLVRDTWNYNPSNTRAPHGNAIDHFEDAIEDLRRFPRILGGFCRRNPHIKLSYVVRHFDILQPPSSESFPHRPHIRKKKPWQAIDVWQIMRFGVFFESVIREKHDATALLPLNRGRPDLMSVIAEYREGSEALSKMEKEGMGQLTALRIFPEIKQWEPGERASVEKALRKDRLSDQSIEQWFDRVEGWMRDGI